MISHGRIPGEKKRNLGRFDDDYDLWTFGPQLGIHLFIHSLTDVRSVNNRIIVSYCIGLLACALPPARPRLRPRYILCVYVYVYIFS